MEISFDSIQDIFDYSDLFYRLLDFLFYMGIFLYLANRYKHTIENIVSNLSKGQEIVRTVCLAMIIGIVTALILECIGIFLAGTGVSLGILPDDSLAGGNTLTTIVAFIIGLTVVSLSLSFYIKKIDEIIQNLTNNDDESE